MLFRGTAWLCVLLSVVYVVEAKTHILPRISDAGYLSINEQKTAFLYFLFFEAQNMNQTDVPILLWLQGGPGCSSLVGAFCELGPYRISPDGQLRMMNSSWNQNNALLFIDQPLGTGFSYVESNSSGDVFPKTEQQAVDQLIFVLQQFFVKHPSLQYRRFYICGESYSGKIIPRLAFRILHDSQVHIRLAGIAIGDGLVDPENQLFVDAETASVFGLVDATQRKEIERKQQYIVDLIRAGKFAEAAKERNDLLDSVQKSAGFNSLLDVRFASPYNFSFLPEYFNAPEVQLALRVRNGSKFVECNTEVRDRLIGDVMRSVKFTFHSILSKIPVLIYLGQFDGRDGVDSAEGWIPTIDWQGKNQWMQQTRRLWFIDNNLIGFVEQVDTLTQVVFRNAGHMVPRDQLHASFVMIEKWLRNETFY